MEISIRLHAAFNGFESEKDIFRELCTTPLLVIDELEKVKGTDYKLTWMSHVIGQRYNHCLPLVIISNCHLQEDCRAAKKPCPRCLESHLGNDMISRLAEDRAILKFHGEDYRCRKHR
jgi:DNA replication protein DnaC